jgi:2,3-bisphosphoglycerate-dependent phosphoglycerate mutase
MPHLILVRHGQSLWNLEDRFTGWVDVPLTALGVQEASNAGLKLKGTNIDVAYTSTLQRAQNTLSGILKSMGIEVPTIRDEALNERHYGDLQGLNKARTAEKFGDEQVKIWRRSFDVPPPNGESLNPWRYCPRKECFGSCSWQLKPFDCHAVRSAHERTSLRT